MSSPVALVTGASRGIGRGIVLELAKSGYDIAGLATQADPANVTKGLHEVKAAVESLGRAFLPVVGDISDLSCHARILDEVESAMGGVDLFVSNAGVAPLERRDILEMTPESYDRVLNINARGPMFLSQLVARHLVGKVEQGNAVRPAIIFVTSISAITASPNRAEYCVSKAALSMVAQNFAVRLAEYGVNVYEVRPGIIATDMTSGVKGKYDDLIAQGLLPQKRWGTPEDIGKAVAALASGAFEYATGAVIEVGGGFGISRL
jgi:NAD(P)-dependent dehydrogenase (short-subunit alcohol dehydrogenase family)